MNIKFKANKVNTFISVGLIAVILILINVIFLRNFYRWDLTEDNQYTISQVSKRTVRNLKDIVTIKVFFTEDLPPNLLTLSQYTHDILDEYEMYSKGNLRVLYLDPARDEEYKKEASGFGVPEVQMNYIEKDKVDVRNGYLGIVVVYRDRHETIPVVQDISNLEYDITSAIKKVLQKEPKTVGFLTGHKEHKIMRNPQNTSEASKADYTSVYEMISQNYAVKKVDISTGEPITDIDTLIVAGPKEKLSKRDLYEIDQFIMNGGNAIFLIDKMEVSSGIRASKVKAGLEKLWN
jgi:gliding-associated putative ABC transporter substrate-binding component GldG